MNREGLVISVVIAITAVLVVLAVSLPQPQPQPQGPPPLPWQEGEKTVRLDPGERPNTEDIYYADPDGAWQQAMCKEIRVPLFPPTPPTDPISDTPGDSPDAVFPEGAEITHEMEVTDSRYYIYNRCECRYRVEWTCTELSRYVTASATLNGQRYVRYIYTRDSWDESKTLYRRLSALAGVTCGSDQDCEDPCRGATPHHSEWGMQCRGNNPHRLHAPPQDF